MRQLAEAHAKAVSRGVALNQSFAEFFFIEKP
jgi:hypothetical protein